MLVLALAALGRAADYLRPARVDSAPFVLREFASIIPVQAWGVLWGLTGVVVLVCAFRRRQGFALGMLASISMIWAVVYTVTAAFGLAGDDTLRAWQGSLAFLSFFVVVVSMARMINPGRIKDVPYA